MRPTVGNLSSAPAEFFGQPVVVPRCVICPDCGGDGHRTRKSHFFSHESTSQYGCDLCNVSPCERCSGYGREGLPAEM